jgi:hypothetical protein
MSEGAGRGNYHRKYVTPTARKRLAGGRGDTHRRRRIYYFFEYITVLASSPAAHRRRRIDAAIVNIPVVSHGTFP